MCPQLPVYNSKANLTTQQPVATQTGAAEPYEAAGKALGVVQDVSQKWSEAVDNMQETSVKARALETQAQVLSESEGDSDINGEESKIKTIKQNNQNILKDVSNPALRSRLAFELDHQTNLSAIKIKGIYAQKKLLADNLNTESLLMSYARDKSQNHDEDAFNLIQGKVASGFYTKHQGEELLKNYRLGSVDFDIQSDPSVTQNSPVLQELQKGKNGIYSKLTDQELADKIKDAKINIWRNKNVQKKQEKETNTQGAIDLSNQLLNGNLSIADVRSLYKNKAIDLATSNAFESILSKETISEPEAKDAGDAKYLIKLASEGDKKDASKILAEAAKMYGNKGLSKQAYGFILQEVSKKFVREKAGLSGWDKTTQIFMNGVKAISDFALSALGIHAITPASNKMVNNYIEKIQKGDDPTEAAKQVQKEAVLEYHPQALTYPEEGRTTMDAQGNIRIILPDGTLKDIEVKKESTKPKGR